MRDVKAPADEWRIGDFFVASDKLEAAAARLVLADGRRWSGQMQQALSGTGQWRSGLQHNHVRESNSVAGGKIALCRPKSQHKRRI